MRRAAGRSPAVPGGVAVAAFAKAVRLPEQLRADFASEGEGRVGEALKEAVQPGGFRMPQVRGEAKAALVDHGPARAALGAPADLDPGGRVEEIPGHGVGEAGTRRGGRGGARQGDGDAAAGEGRGEGLVDPAVALRRRSERGRASGGECEEEGEILPVLDEAAPGVATDGSGSACGEIRPEVAQGEGGTIPVVEPRDGTPGPARPEEEGLVEGHVLRRPTEDGVAPVVETGQFHGKRGGWGSWEPCRETGRGQIKEFVILREACFLAVRFGPLLTWRNW